MVEIGGIHRVCTAAAKAGLKLVEDNESLYLAGKSLSRLSFPLLLHHPLSASPPLRFSERVTSSRSVTCFRRQEAQIAFFDEDIAGSWDVHVSAAAAASFSGSVFWL